MSVMVLIMNRKKVIFLLVSLVFMVSFASVANAQTQDFVPQILKDFFKWLFLTLPEQAQAGDKTFVIYFRLILWVLVFAIVYFGASKVFKQEGTNRVAVVVSAIFALISVMFIPEAILLFLFTTYSAVVSVLLGLAPVFIGIYIRRHLPPDQPTFANLITLGVGILSLFVGFYFIGYAVTGSATQAFGMFGQWISIGGIIAIIWAIFGLWAGFRLEPGSGAGAAATPQAAAAARDEADESATEARERKEEQAEIVLTLEEFKEVRRVYDEINQLKITLDGYATTGTITAADVATYNNRIDEINSELNTLIAQDEQIKQYAEKIVSEAKVRLAKTKSEDKKQKIRGQRKQANTVLTQYRATGITNALERMVLYIKPILDGTKGLAGASPGAHDPGLHATKLQTALDQLKKTHNIIVRLLRIENKALKEIV